jgi:hypothetical protein
MVDIDGDVKLPEVGEQIGVVDLTGHQIASVGSRVSKDFLQAER